MTTSSIKKSTNVRSRTTALILRAVALFSPALAATFLERLFLTTRRFEAPPRETSWLEQLDPCTFVSRGVELAAWAGGAGPKILLAHGWEGRGSQMGAFVQPLIAAGFGVVMFDGPGHGRSPARASSLVEMAEAIEDAARAFGPFRAAIAHSAGAAATAVALSRGTAIERAVFVAPPSDLGGFLHKISRRLGLPDTVAVMTQRRLEERFRIQWESLRAELIAPRMKTPLLVIHDEGDRDVRYDNATRLVGLWPNAELMTTTGLGHRRVLRDGEVVTRAVAFVAGSRAPSTKRQASRAVGSSAAV